MSTGPELSVVLPTFNERDNIGPLIERLGAALDGIDYEILVLDDRSPDGTADVVRAIEARDARVHLVLREPPAGLARSLAEGVARARGRFVAWLDCDFSHPPERVPDLLAPVRSGEAAIACTSRYVPGGGDDRNSRLLRWASIVINWLARVAIDGRVRDYTTGNIVAPRQLIADLGLRGDYGEYCIALLADALRGGHRVVELPYRLVSRTHGESKTAPNLRQFARRGLKYLRAVATESRWARGNQAGSGR